MLGSTPLGAAFGSRYTPRSARRRPWALGRIGLLQKEPLSVRHGGL